MTPNVASRSIKKLSVTVLTLYCPGPFIGSLNIYSETFYNYEDEAELRAEFINGAIFESTMMDITVTVRFNNEPSISFRKGRSIGDTAHQTLHQEQTRWGKREQAGEV